MVKIKKKQYSKNLPKSPCCTMQCERAPLKPRLTWLSNGFVGLSKFSQLHSENRPETH